MAQRGMWPNAADRFAADLGWVDQIGHPELQALTEAVGQAPIPILTGGHSIVSGSLLAMAETLDPKPFADGRS
jgi:hypothetical protein